MTEIFNLYQETLRSGKKGETLCQIDSRTEWEASPPWQDIVTDSIRAASTPEWSWTDEKTEDSSWVKVRTEQDVLSLCLHVNREKVSKAITEKALYIFWSLKC